ncbi:unnamed protein product [Caenorhabditis nigoni]
MILQPPSLTHASPSLVAPTPPDCPILIYTQNSFDTSSLMAYKRIHNNDRKPFYQKYRSLNFWLINSFLRSSNDPLANTN